MASIPFTGRTERSRDSWHWALPLLPIAISVFLLSALTWQRTQGDLGEGLLPGLVVGMSDFLGFQPAFMLCLLVMAWSSIWFFTAKIERPGARMLKILALTLCLSILVSLSDGGNVERASSLGSALAGRLVYVFGFTFSSLLVAAAALVFFLLSTDFFFYSYFEGIGRDSQRSKTSLDDEGVEAATVQAFESLASKPRERREIRAERAALRRRSPSGRATLVIEDDPLDRVFPGPLETTVAELAREEEAVAEIEEPLSAEELLSSGDDLEIEAQNVEGIRVIERPEPAVEAEAEDAEEREPVEVTADLELAVAEISADEEEEEELEGEEIEYEEEEEEEEEEYEDEEEAEISADEEEEEAEEDEEEEEEEEEDEEYEYEYEEVEYEAEDEEEEEDEEAPEEIEASAEPPVLLPRPRRHSKRQGTLFPSAEGDGNLVDEAARLVIANDRASASFLRRRLRISRQEALGVIQSLHDQGVVDCAEGASQGRVIMDLAEWESR